MYNTIYSAENLIRLNALKMCKDMSTDINAKSCSPDNYYHGFITPYKTMESEERELFYTTFKCEDKGTLEDNSLQIIKISPENGNFQEKLSDCASRDSDTQKSYADLVTHLTSPIRKQPLTKCRFHKHDNHFVQTCNMLAASVTGLNEWCANDYSNHDKHEPLHVYHKEVGNHGTGDITHF